MSRPLVEPRRAIRARVLADHRLSTDEALALLRRARSRLPLSYATLHTAPGLGDGQFAYDVYAADELGCALSVQPTGNDLALVSVHTCSPDFPWRHAMTTTIQWTAGEKEFCAYAVQPVETDRSCCVAM